MTEESLLELVAQEAAAIRKHAIKSELDQLDFNELDPEAADSCIYGQMTGNCFNTRAKELLTLCAVPFSGSIIYLSPVGDRAFYEDMYLTRDFSALEYYITQPYAKNAELIAYLKGETDTLNL